MKHRVAHEGRGDLLQRSRTAEQELRGTFRLAGRPVVVHGLGPEGLPVKRVQGPGDPTERVRPVGPQLSIHEPPSQARVRHVDEGVIGTAEAGLPVAEGLEQPLPSVELDLDTQGKPRLKPRAHEACKNLPTLREECPVMNLFGRGRQPAAP